MKILAIDDQRLILLSVEKKLTELGYKVKTATSASEGIKLYQDFQPDLVLLDMNMPDMAGNRVVECTGTEVVKYIRLFVKDDTPILVMSGNYRETVIIENFKFGINDYIKKPVSLDEIAMRIKRIIGSPNTDSEDIKTSYSQIVQKSCVGIVIPCYNEAERLNSKEFESFALKNLGYHICFVNDGSTDNTLKALHQIRKGNEDNITVYNCKKNGGKAEAVRLGMLHMAKESQYDYLGYLDADKNPFVTKWLFDVEIFMRMRKLFGKELATDSICEQPLKRWIHADGSKLSMSDSFKIFSQLLFLGWKYRGIGKVIS